jgi:hypothetical protein
VAHGVASYGFALPNRLCCVFWQKGQGDLERSRGFLKWPIGLDWQLAADRRFLIWHSRQRQTPAGGWQHHHCHPGNILRLVLADLTLQHVLF